MVALLISVPLYPFFIRSMEEAAQRKAAGMSRDASRRDHAHESYTAHEGVRHAADYHARVAAAARAFAAACSRSRAAPAAKKRSADAEPPGLPAGVDWTFNFDATAGAFGFADSLYTNPKPEQPSGDLERQLDRRVDQGRAERRDTRRTARRSSTASSARVGERTFGAAPSLVGERRHLVRSRRPLHRLALRQQLGDEENVLDFTVGRAQYKLGHGMLLYDGASEGGSRGGYWTNARKAFEFAAIGRFKPGNHTIEAFYLDKDDLPEADSSAASSGASTTSTRSARTRRSAPPT